MMPTAVPFTLGVPLLHPPGPSSSISAFPPGSSEREELTRLRKENRGILKESRGLLRERKALR